MVVGYVKNTELKSLEKRWFISKRETVESAITSFKEFAKEQNGMFAGWTTRLVAYIECDVSDIIHAKFRERLSDYGGPDQTEIREISGDLYDDIERELAKKEKIPRCILSNIVML